MHLSGLSVDLNWLVQFVFTALAIGFGVLHVVKNTASKYFVVDANFEGNASSAGAESPEIDRSIMPGVSTCAFCGDVAAKKQCSGCKSVRYCSQKCQREHWLSGHKKKCKDSQHGRKSSGFGSRNSTGVVLVHDVGNSNTLKQSKKILFPYDEFIKYFNWDNPGFPPCGLLNCGNSCFANVVLQCLAHTRPLVAYLLEKGHRKECGRNDWCFLCEFQAHVERASHSQQPFSPINILSRLPYLGGNLGYGKQEDAHEFMRFAIDTMQSVCLDEFGGEKSVHPRSQETTLIQHIFGGHLQSQVICTKCNKISNQYENMMDLTVEIQGDAASLEECLDQFTVKEWLHGENMYRCDGCNDYVKAWKRLTVRQAPNILTIALKRFQSGRFGKLNKRVTFPETLDLSPYMTEAVDGANVYKLYAVVVHLDMLNASYFGHYICYVKDFRGNWYRIDDCKVVNVELDEVLSQGAYMLLYSRVSARSSCLNSLEASKTEEQHMVDLALEVEPCTKASVATGDSSDPITACGPVPADSCQHIKISNYEELSSGTNFEALREDSEDVEMMDHWSCPLVPKEVVVHSDGQLNAKESAEHEQRLVSATSCSSEISSGEARELRCELPSSYSEIVDGDSFKSSCVGEVVSLNPTKSPVPTQNGVCGKAETSNDASFANIGSVEESSLVVSSKSLPVSSSERLEKDESGEDLQRPICTAGYSAEGCPSSGPNLKPLFPSGFLVKRPCNKSVKRHRSSLQESDKLIPASKVDSNSNGFLKSGFLNQKGDNIKGQAEAHLDCNGLSSGRSVQEPPENCLNEVEMIDINLGESVSICNGDTSDDKNARDFTMNDAEEKTVCTKTDDGCNGLAYSIDAPFREKSLAIDGDVQE